MPALATRRQRCKLVANGCPDKIGTVGIEPFLDEQIDMAKVNIAEVDRYLLTIACLRSKLADIVAIDPPSSYHLYGWYTADSAVSSRKASSTPLMRMLLAPEPAP
jgi:hypothetical protein